MTSTKRAWIDGRHALVNHRLWGLTLLERNVRELARLGFEAITVVTTADGEPGRNFCHQLPARVTVGFESLGEGSLRGRLAAELRREAVPVLVLEGHAFNDRRVLQRLMESEGSCGLVSPGGSRRAGAAILSARDADWLRAASSDDLAEALGEALEACELPELDLSDFDPYVKNLRRTIDPFLLRVEGPEQLAEMDELLRQQVHKGVLEFVAKHIHPPLEFGTVKLIAHTRISPNMITVVWLVLAAITVPLFATGHLLPGVILAAVSGVLDGVDGKLARLTLRFSRTGDLLDHVGGTVYDAIWYLALGWYFAGGDPVSTGAIFTFILFFSYLVERIVPGVFRKLHKAEIHDYEGIDVFVRFIGSRMNNNIWVLLIGVLLGVARETFYFISVWMLVTAAWHTVRLLHVTWREKVRSPAHAP